MARRTQSRSRDDQSDSFEDEEDFGSGFESSRERLQQLIRELLGRWHWIALGLVLGLLGAFYYLSKAPRIYEATSTLLVKQGASSVISNDQDEELDYRSVDAVNTVAQRVKRSALLTKVASAPAVSALPGLIPAKVNWFPAWTRSWLGGDSGEELDPAQSDAAALGRKIESWTTVSVRRNTRLLDITVSHPNPEVARVLADTIATEYVNELALKRSTGDTSSSDILGSSASEVQAALQAAQNALANYQQVLETLKELEEKELVFSELDRRYLAKHPKLIAAKATLEEYQKRFLSEFEAVRKALADKAFWDESQTELEQASLEEAGGDSGARLQTAKRLLTARASVLASEIENKTEFYNSMLTKLQVSDINLKALDAEVELSNLSLLPEYPVSPKKTTTVAGGGILGCGLGFALAFLLVKLDNKIHTVPQAELLTGLHVLATIRDVQPKVLEKIIAEKGESGAGLAPAARKWDQRIVFRPGLTDTLYAEMFRILRASVTLLGDETKRKVTLFSSALPGEGKTLVSANFAIASALQGKKTLLLDLDLRKPAVHKIFGLKRNELASGVTELLAGKISWQEALSQETGQENLSCIFAGVKAPNPGELLSSDAVANLLEQLEGEFDVIVIDSAPLLAVPDTRLLIPIVDNFCLVIRAEQTAKGAIRKALDLLEDDGTEPAGIVVNGYQEKSGLLARKYGYGYGGYGGYGQYGQGYGSGSYGSYGSDEDDD